MIEVSGDTWRAVKALLDKEIKDCTDRLMQDGTSHDESQYLRGRIHACRGIIAEVETPLQNTQR